MSNNLRTRDGLPFNFVNGLKVRGMDIESLIPGIEGIPEAGSKYQFAGNGTNKIFTLPVSPYNKDAVDVHVKQLYVHPDDYTLVGDTLTLTEAPPALEVGETYNVVVKVNLTMLNGYVNASRVSFEGENLDDILEKSKPLANYSALRAYAGSATQIRITDPGIAGFFYLDGTTTSLSEDNGGTIIVSSNGKRWKRIYEGAVNVLWFGSSGNGITDDSVSFQTAIDYSASINRGVDLNGLTFYVTGVRIRNGLRYLKNGTIIPAGRTVKAAILLDGGSVGGTAVNGFVLEKIDVDCKNNPEHVVYAEGCIYCKFQNNNFYNLQGNTLPVNHGIMLCEGAKYNHITFNTINAIQYSTSGVLIGLYSVGVDATYGYFTNATGNITAALNPCEHNTVIGNRVFGGQQGIWISGGHKNNICDNNIEGSRDRGIILIASTGNTISGNNIFDSKSAGIHLAYGCTQNAITGNRILQPNSAGGEGGIQAYVGCGGNTIVANNIQTECNYGIYIGVSSNYNTVHSNRIQRYAIAGICIQSDWWGSGGQGVYGRPNYASPTVGNRWAFTNTIGNSIKDNWIGDPNNTGNISGNDCGIAIIQSKSADGSSQFTITNIDISNNKIQTSSLTHNVYIFSEISTGITNCNLIGNTFSDPQLQKFSGNNFVSPDAFSYAFDLIVQNSGLNTIQSWAPLVKGSATEGTATYTKQFGRYVRTDRDFVEFQIEVSWTGHTGTGGTTVTLPLLPMTVGQNGFTAPVVVECANIPLTTSKWIAALIGGGNAVINIYEFQTGTIEDYLLLNSAGTLRLSGKYRIR